MGNEGTIEVLNRQILTFTPETFGGKAPAHVAARKAMKVEKPGNDNLAVEAHITNWLDAIRGKAKLIERLKDPAERAKCKEVVEKLIAAHGQQLVGWRKVPTQSAKAKSLSPHPHRFGNTTPSRRWMSADPDPTVRGVVAQPISSIVSWAR